MRFAALLLSVCVLAFPASGAVPAQNVAAVANPTEVAVYVPPSALTLRSYLAGFNLWVEPGKAIEDAVRQVGAGYFPALHLVPAAKDEPYGLLLDLAPKWEPAAGKLQLKVQYDVYGVDGKKLHAGNIEQLVPIKAGNFNAAATQAARLAVQRIMLDVQGRLSPDPVKFPPSGSTAKIDLAPLVDHEKPLRTGTAFFINQAGQLLTAAHVARDCALLEVHQDNASFPVTASASSALLDVAVLDSGKPRAAALPMREGNAIVLGEAITSVGYPLHGLLGDSPNLTRGNVSASKGIKGSMGHFQFSAPIQPGNSGGPIVSDNGELLGMAVSTLNAESLAKLGLIPQNVNFALDGKYVTMFLRKENVAFDTIKPQGVGSMQAANQAALSNTVQLSCYQ